MDERLDNEEKPVVNARAGEVVRAARIAAGVDLSKISAALRVSNAALEALEAGQYDRLPGEPYVRALLGSVARHLGLDPVKLLQTYNAEIGAKTEEAPARPYKDSSQVHILAHKKWFVALLIFLLVALLVILGKVNSSSDRSEAAIAPTPHADTAVSLAAPSDSLSENKSLSPDSLNGKIDTVSKTAIKRDTSRAMVTAKIDTVRKVAAKEVPPRTRDSVTKAPPTVTSTMNRLSVKPLVDSVWMRVIRKGKPEEVILLRTGNPPVDVAHSDTIILIIGKRRSVEVAYGDSTFIPLKKRFKLYGKKISYF